MFVLHVFSVKPFLWLWYNRFFSNGKICYYDQTSADFDKISEVFPYYQIVAAGNSRNSTNPQVAAKAALICLLVVLFLKRNCRRSCEFSPTYNGPGSK
jgi:hypothetical protein